MGRSGSGLYNGTFTDSGEESGEQASRIAPALLLLQVKPALPLLRASAYYTLLHTPPLLLQGSEHLRILSTSPAPGR